MDRYDAIQIGPALKTAALALFKTKAPAVWPFHVLLLQAETELPKGWTLWESVGWMELQFASCLDPKLPSFFCFHVQTRLRRCLPDFG